MEATQNIKTVREEAKHYRRKGLDLLGREFLVCVFLLIVIQIKYALQ